MARPKQGPKVIWEPQPGSQVRFLSCPVFEALYEGTRGPGKTDALIMDFTQFVGMGFGPAWKGIIFRCEYKHLEDVIAKSTKWIPQIFPKARFLESSSHLKWIFPDGEQLLFRAAAAEKDYWSYHGHEYPWLGFEELTNWPSPAFYTAMFSVCRSTSPDPRMPRHIRATSNPFGVGHNWVKARFIDPAPREKIIRDENGRARVAIHGSIYENKILLVRDPQYLKNLESDTNLNRKKAWLFGDWDIVAGGAIDDVWDRDRHVLKPFKIPSTWYVNRSFDWGSSHPFSVGWWAESDGSRVEVAPGKFRTFPRGTLFRIAEWYGWNGQPNEGCKMNSDQIGKGVKDRETKLMEAFQLSRINAGPADSSIFDDREGDSIAAAIDRGYGRTCFTMANKAPGTRHQRLELLRNRLSAGKADHMEEPGFFVFDNCSSWLRTVPVLPRDERDPDDVDTKAEDHAYDETGYRLLEVRARSGMRSIGAA